MWNRHTMFNLAALSHSTVCQTLSKRRGLPPKGACHGCVVSVPLVGDCFLNIATNANIVECASSAVIRTRRRYRWDFPAAAAESPTNT